MKKLVVFCFACICLTNIYAQDFFRYVEGKKQYFDVSPNKVIVKFDRELTEEAIERFFRENGGKLVLDAGFDVINNEIDVQLGGEFEIL